MGRKVVLAAALAGISLISLFVSCLTGPTGPAGPSLSGALSGYIVLVNSDGFQPANRGGVSVSLDPTSLSAQTNSTGKWIIPDVKTGTYNLTYSKSGYGISKSIGTQYVGGNDRDLGVIYLCTPPSISFDSLAYFQKKADSTSIWIRAYLSTDATGIPYRTLLAFSHDTNITSATSVNQYTLFFNTSFANGIDSTNIKITPEIFSTAGFSIGDTVYVAGYLANAGTNTSSYLDTASGRTQYTNFNTQRSNPQGG